MLYLSSSFVTLTVSFLKLNHTGRQYRQYRQYIVEGGLSQATFFCDPSNSINSKGTTQVRNKLSPC